MNKKNGKILGIGSPIIDLSCRVDDDLLCRYAGEKSTAKRCSFAELDRICNDLNLNGLSLQKFSGGSAGNAMKVLGRLIKFFGDENKYVVSFGGVAGSDEFGEFFREELSGCGVDLKYLTCIPNFRSDCCMALVTSDGERTFLTAVDASLQMNQNWAEKIDFSKFDTVLVEAYQLYNRGFFLPLIDLIKSSGAEVALDLGSVEVIRTFRQELIKVFNERKLDIVFANESEAEAFAACGSPYKNCLALAEKCRIAVVKIGAGGAYVASNGEIFHSPGQKVSVIDTTGAGDSWAGTFLYCRLKNLSLQECASLANKVAAITVQSYGTEMDLASHSALFK